ncbi:cell division protein FtsQ [Enterococcus sp. AZ194]|uniref:cell division protein FtsQ/DivIB n=1 Tax=Enterococcus sp. AZ194 TaxID=2774629 RepID=UPI003F20E673
MTSITKKIEDNTEENEEISLSKRTPEKEDEELTPWQKENLRYMEKQGERPAWQPSVIDGRSETPSDEVEEEEETSEDVTEDNVEDDDESLKIKQHENGPINGSFADRLPQLKKQRNTVLYRRLTLIICILIIPLLFFLYYVSPLSKLNKVVISGNDHVNAEEILSDSKFVSGDRLWEQYWARGVAEETIEKNFPRVKSAKITLDGLNNLKIQIFEYKEAALLSQKKGYYPIMENGAIVKEKVDKPTASLPILENFTDEGKIKDLLEEYKNIPEEIQKSISQIKYAPRKNNDELLEIFMNDGNQILVNISNLSQQIVYYPQVSKEMKEKGIIDMEVGIFSSPYKNESSDENNSQTNESSDTNQ